MKSKCLGFQFAFANTFTSAFAKTFHVKVSIPPKPELVCSSPEVNPCFPGDVSQPYTYDNKELDVTAEEFENLGLITIIFPITCNWKAIVLKIKTNDIVSSQFSRKIKKAFANISRWTPVEGVVEKSQVAICCRSTIDQLMHFSYIFRVCWYCNEF